MLASEIAPACMRSPARIAAAARLALELEITTFPKPGLVSHVDRGSHDDMDAALLCASAAALEPFFAELAAAGARARPFAVLRDIGIAAERAMLSATGGVNTHRGAIFALGLLCAAAGTNEAASRRLGAIVRDRWGAALADLAPAPESHGNRAMLHHGAGGARAEAAGGFASLYGVGLPALARARRLVSNDAEAARVEACFALVAHVEDTNLLHRGGPEALAFARDQARGFLTRGGVAAVDWRRAAETIHHAFVARRLSPGGSADLLAATLLVDSLEGPAR